MGTHLKQVSQVILRQAYYRVKAFIVRTFLPKSCTDKLLLNNEF